MKRVIKRARLAEKDAEAAKKDAEAAKKDAAEAKDEDGIFFDTLMQACKHVEIHERFEFELLTFKYEGLALTEKISKPLVTFVENVVALLNGPYYTVNAPFVAGNDTPEKFKQIVKDFEAHCLLITAYLRNSDHNDPFSISTSSVSERFKATNTIVHLKMVFKRGSTSTNMCFDIVF
jgi:hypothetical protein